MAQKNMKNVSFVPEDVQRILSSHKISEKCNKQKVFYKKAVLKIFPIFIEKHLCWSLFSNKNAGLQACNFIKKRLQHRCLLANIAKFLGTSIQKNIRERLLLRVFPFMLVERFHIWTNNITCYIGSEEVVFSKTKENKAILKLS